MGYHLRAEAAAGPRETGCATRGARAPRTGVGSGYRYYVPGLGRWISRDPIEEVGGSHLYAKSRNNALVRFDILGLLETIQHKGPVRRWRDGGLTVALSSRDVQPAGMSRIWYTIDYEFAVAGTITYCGCDGFIVSRRVRFVRHGTIRHRVPGDPILLVPDVNLIGVNYRAAKDGLREWLRKIIVGTLGRDLVIPVARKTFLLGAIVHEELGADARSALEARVPRHLDEFEIEGLVLLPCP